ncbi:MAG: T9SS type A sorting domain-containing protein [Bacteroidetes bacterium]|nr:T9SS type A sorting domain-containing protein [Bacteroidota bacterium]
MKNICLLVTIILTASAKIATGQCPSRAYNPSWDWRGKVVYSFNTLDVNNQPNIITKISPWYDSITNNPNINRFVTQFPKDYEPNDGWVLIQRDFGNPVPINNPYFILYNKFSGILRVFVLVTRQYNGYTDAVINLKFANGSIKTAILENHSTNAGRSALDNFDNQVPEINIPNRYSNDTPYWLSADFSIAYDPCTCNSLSQLIFEASLISTANLAFNTYGTPKSGLDATGNGSNEKQSLAKTGQAIVDAGNSFFSTASDAINNIKNSFPNASAGTKSDLEKLGTIVPGISAIVGIVDFLSGLFGGGSDTSTASDINLTSTGTITTTAPYKSVIFANPGSANLSLVPSTLIKYNNTLGVFNVLETPEVAAGQWDINYGFRTVTYNGYYVTQPPAYVINPNSGYDAGLSDIKAALVYEILDYGFIMPNFGFSAQNTIIEEERRGALRTFRTKYVPINNVSDLYMQIESYQPNFYNQPLSTIPKWIYLKVTAVLNDGKGHQGVFVTKLTTKPSSFISIPTSLQYVPEDIVINSGIANNVRAWNTATINNGASFSSSGISVIAGNSVTLTPGASLTNQASMKAGTPNGNPTVISQGDPSGICVSSTYVSKATQFARVASEPEPEEKAFQVDEKETTAFPNPTNGSVSFRYYVGEPTQVRLNLISTTGSVIATPVDAYQEAGPYEVGYDANNLPSGIYIYTLETSKGKETKRLVIIK